MTDQTNPTPAEAVAEAPKQPAVEGLTPEAATEILKEATKDPTWEAKRLRRFIRSGELKATKYGNRWGIAPEALQEFAAYYNQKLEKAKAEAAAAEVAPAEAPQPELLN